MSKPQWLIDITINVIDKLKDQMFKVEICKLNVSAKSLREQCKVDNLFDIKHPELKQAIDNILEKHSEYYKTEFFDHLFKTQKYSEWTLKKLVDVIRLKSYHHDLDYDLKPETVITMKKSRINNFYDHRLVETKQKRLYVSNMFDIVYNFFN